MVLAADLRGARIDRILPGIVHHAAVLDHAALGEDHHLAALEDLGGEEGQQAGMVVGHRADAAQIAPQPRTIEEFRRGHRSRQDSALFVDQILRNEGFEAGEMVEQIDVAVIDLPMRPMDANIEGKCPLQPCHIAHRAVDAGLIEAVVDLFDGIQSGILFAGAKDKAR